MKGFSTHLSMMHKENYPERYKCVECGVKVKTTREAFRHLNKCKGVYRSSKLTKEQPVAGSFDHIELAYSSDADSSYLPTHIDARVENNELIITVEIPKNIGLVEELRAIMYGNMFERRSENSKKLIIFG